MCVFQIWKNYKDGKITEENMEKFWKVFMGEADETIFSDEKEKVRKGRK